MPEVPAEGRSPERPVIVGQPGSSYLVRAPSGRGRQPSGRFTDEQQRLARLDTKFMEAEAAFFQQVELTSSLPDSDPHLVLVLIAAETTVDLTAVARRLGFDVLVDVDESVDADEEYSSAASHDVPRSFPASLYAVAAEHSAFDAILSTWRTWRETQAVPRGSAPLRDLFKQLKDIRPWGPQDRLQFSDWSTVLKQSLDATVHPVEVELWFYGSESKRSAAQQRVTALLERDRGRVLYSAQVEAVGYRGLACELPTEVLLRLARGEYADVQVVRSADVMFLKVGGQQVTAPDGGDEETSAAPSGPLPSGDPVVCLLDGVPVANHDYLAGRVVIHDPDDLSAQAPADQRRHGTAMVSVAVWGDLGDHGATPAPRPVLVRPVMAPSAFGSQSIEEIPRAQLVPDLMVRVFRELFERDGADGPIAPQVVVVSLSIGDPATRFATFISSWARTLDHLSEQYGALVVVSAGNHSRLELPGIDARTLQDLHGNARRDAVMAAVRRQRIDRSLLAPAEAINAVTVGALHADASGISPVGYQLDPADGTSSISPVSALGSGLRQSIKPEVAAAGGRVTYVQPMQEGAALTFRGGTLTGPGIRVAAPSSPRDTTHTAGTSPAAAAVARRAGLLSDLVDSLFPGAQLTRQQRAVAIKALLVHGTERPEGLVSIPDLADVAIGHGDIARDLAGGCAPHEATILFMGVLRAGEAQQLDLPLPDGLALRGVKRVTATLAWLSPINWRHRQYRRAKLSFATPAGPMMPKLGSATGLRIGSSQRGATTVQHGTWETSRAFAGGHGDVCSILVTCQEQAGGLGGEVVPYGVAVSLWTSPSLQVDVYNQVAQQIRTATAVRPPLR